MKPKLSLTTRAFLFACIPMCLVAVVSFFAINAAIQGKIKKDLSESLHRTEISLAKTRAVYDRLNRRQLAIVGENAELKEQISLFQEAASDPISQSQIRQAMEVQLRELDRHLEYDLLVVADSQGALIGGIVVQEGRKISLDARSIAFDSSPFIHVQGTPYEATTVPVGLGAENLGSLTAGRKFDLSALSHLGAVALVGDHKVLLSTFPAGMVGEVEHGLQTRCARNEDECEIEIGGETYLALPVNPANWEGAYQLLSFQSIDAAKGEFTSDFQMVFLWIGLGGVLVVLLFSKMGSRSISKPLTDLIERLRTSERAGRLNSNLTTRSPATEVNVLARAFNRAAGAVRESQEQLDEATLEFIETMAQALDARDPYTAGHSNRVSRNSTAVANAMALPADQIEIIRIGAKLHDIGKIGIPDNILQKPGRLGEEELALIKRHPQIGKRILEKVGSFQEYLPIVELHHENHDGSGYPYGLKGEEIPLGVRIVHVVDVYDALSSDRAYRKALSWKEASQLLVSGSGTQFDPDVVELFLFMFRECKVLDNVFRPSSGVTGPGTGDEHYAVNVAGLIGEKLSEYAASISNKLVTRN